MGGSRLGGFTCPPVGGREECSVLVGTGTAVGDFPLLSLQPGGSGRTTLDGRDVKFGRRQFFSRFANICRIFGAKYN